MKSPSAPDGWISVPSTDQTVSATSAKIDEKSATMNVG